VTALRPRSGVDGPEARPTSRPRTMIRRPLFRLSSVAHVGGGLFRELTRREGPPAPASQAGSADVRQNGAVAFWSLSAGVGTSTIAALVAHRSAAAGHPPVLVDLDRWVPVLGVRARGTGAHVVDALLRAGEETALLSRWGDVAFLQGCADLHRAFEGPRVAELIARLRHYRPVVLDLGPGAEALDPDVLAAIDRLCVVVGPTIAQLQAAFCAVPLLVGQPVRVDLVTVGVAPDDAARIGTRLPWPSLGSIPRDPFLAHDEFAARAPTVRAVDALIRGLD